ncbi:HNH endonuclease family protein [Pseudonocardia nematodicida]|uniref:HNH endonuclease family protein n=1 Tax=Pseudonocardia nematodicida TaxID=1206997 RepID=A0ABV1KJQ7_9PSEU
MRVRRWKQVALAATVLVTVSGCGSPGAFADALDSAIEAGVFDPAESGAGDSAGTYAVWADGREAAPGSAAAQVTGLEVKGRAPKTGYSRDEFGRRWADVDRDGCDQRNQVLARDMDGETFKPGTRDCVVLTGVLQGSYTGKTIEFTRGQDTSTAVQIDHVVALSDAWQKGAQQLDPQTREMIGNDPLNLIAVDGPTNARKGDGDAATWLPPDAGYRCAYVARQVAVKAKYDLWVTAAERDAMNRVLGSCPDRASTTDADAAQPAHTLR